MISVSLLDSNTAQVVWRDNSTDELGFLVLACDSHWVPSRVIDTLPANSVSYIDEWLAPNTTYRYKVMAFNAASFSDTSLFDSVTTGSFLYPPRFTWGSYSFHVAAGTGCGTADKPCVVLTLHDLNKIENGYRIYRQEGLTVDVRDTVGCRVAELASPNPDDTGLIVWEDTTVRAETWYSYFVKAYTDTAELGLDLYDSVFTNPGSFLIPLTVTFLGEGSSFLHATLWACIYHDTLFIQENFSGLDRFSLIDMKNPAQPAFLGFADTALLRRYDGTEVGTWNKAWESPFFDFTDGKVYYQNTLRGPVCERDFMAQDIARCAVDSGIVSCFPVFDGAVIAYLYASKIMQLGWGVGAVNVHTGNTSRDSIGRTNQGPGKIICDSGTCVLCLKDASYQGSSMAVLDVDREANIYYRSRSSQQVFDTSRALPAMVMTYPYLICGSGEKILAMNIFSCKFYEVARTGFGIWKLLLDREHNQLIAFGQSQFHVYSLNIDVRKVGAERKARRPVLASIEAYPNPFNPSVTIKVPVFVKSAGLSIYDIAGKKVFNLPSVKTNEIVFDGRSLASGMYIVRAVVDGQRYVKKIVFRK